MNEEQLPQHVLKEHRHLFDNPDILPLFAYAPAGLGHLRVSHALYDGVIPEATPILLGSHDKTIAFLHRLLSINPLLRLLFEMAGRGIVEDVATYFYRLFLRSHTKELYAQIATIIDERIHTPKVVLIIATHFGLAHQMAAIKKELEKEKKVRVVLVIQVTDDSPHHIWCVPEADITFVPSVKTKRGLQHYGKIFYNTEIRCEVISFPLSLVLRKKLSPRDFKKRVQQVTFDEKEPTQVMIPLSGAAVGTDYYTAIIDELYKSTKRFTFHVIGRNAPFTKKFIEEMMDRRYVALSVFTQDRDVVDAYQKAYEEKLFSLEITKPSEQAFKALYTCEERGAALLLFTEPVGQQEYDNLDFLLRHHLIPSHHEQELLFRYAAEDTYEGKYIEEILEAAVHWRGIQLPKDPAVAANFIAWCLKVGILRQMMNCKISPDVRDPRSLELRSDGVKIFWDTVTTYLSDFIDLKSS